MDKSLLQQQVLERLAEDLLQTEQAARAAHETATHAENIAENKYDTLGLEAAYLATGQARRAEAIRQAMANWRQFRPRPYDASKGIQLGALVCLIDSDDKQQQLFLGPDGGSMKLVSGAPSSRCTWICRRSVMAAPTTALRPLRASGTSSALWPSRPLVVAPSFP